MNWFTHTSTVSKFPARRILVFHCSDNVSVLFSVDLGDVRADIIGNWVEHLRGRNVRNDQKGSDGFHSIFNIDINLNKASR